MDITKLFFKPTPTQLESINAISASCLKHGIVTPEQQAYVFATAYHESNLTPIEERGKGAGHDYGKMFDIDANGKHIPYTTPNKLYYGRGFVQLTWRWNYKEFGKLLNIPLLEQPELALQIPVAAEIIALGMGRGLFTGVGLSRYFNIHGNDPVNARRIINGVDCADKIAGYYTHFLGLIT